jgi:hypothetical protein
VALSYDRRIRPGLEQVVGPGGVAHSLVTRHRTDPTRVDLHLRAYPGQARNWVTLYCGLTKPLDLIETNGWFRLRSHGTWRAFAPELPWNRRLDASDLALVWPEVEAYLDIVLPAIESSRWFGKEGAVQTAVTRLRHGGLTVFDREACPSFADTQEKLQVMGEESRLLTGRLAGTEAWWALPRLGEECDALALDGQGRLLAIEVKPGSAGAKSIAFSPLQASYYARLFRRWAEQASSPQESLDGVIAQRARLGLAHAGVPAASPLAIVPVVILGGGSPSKEVLRRCQVVRKLILDDCLVEELQLWALDADGKLTSLVD